MAYVYILRSQKDGNKYIGSTIDLEKRLKRHNNGYVISTKYRRPLILVAYQICETIEQASNLERRYKRSHGFLDRAIKAGKFVLINGD